jgi:RNA polymerase subunit RPABC4/transcription elongation factor Spt4
MCEICDALGQWVCDRCGAICSTSEGLCPECGRLQALSDSEGIFVGWLDALS